MAQYLGSKTLDSSSNAAGYINHAAGGSSSLARTMPYTEYTARPTDLYRQSSLTYKSGTTDTSYATTYGASYTTSGYASSPGNPSTTARAGSVPRGASFMTGTTTQPSGSQALQSSYTVSTSLQRAPSYQHQQYSTADAHRGGIGVYSSSSSGGYGGGVSPGGLRTMPGSGSGMGQSILANMPQGSAGNSGAGKAQVQRSTATSGFSHLLRAPNSALGSTATAGGLPQRTASSYATSGFPRSATGQDVIDSTRRYSAGGGMLPRPPIISNSTVKTGSLAGYPASQDGFYTSTATSSSHAYQAYRQLPTRPVSMNGATPSGAGYTLRQAPASTASQYSSSAVANLTGLPQYSSSAVGLTQPPRTMPAVMSPAEYGSGQNGVSQPQDRRLATTVSGSPMLMGLAASAAGVQAATSGATSSIPTPLSIPQQAGFADPSPSAGSSISPYLRPSASSVYGGTDTPNSPNRSPAPSPHGQAIATQHINEQPVVTPPPYTGQQGYGTAIETLGAKVAAGQVVTPSPCRPRNRVSTSQEPSTQPTRSDSDNHTRKQEDLRMDTTSLRQDASSRSVTVDQDGKRAVAAISSPGGRISRQSSGKSELGGGAAARSNSGGLAQLIRTETDGSRGSSRGSLNSTVEPRQPHTPPKSRHSPKQDSGASRRRVQEQQLQFEQEQAQQQQPQHSGIIYQQQQAPGSPVTAETRPSQRQSTGTSSSSSRSDPPDTQTIKSAQKAKSPAKLKAHALHESASDTSDTDSDHEVVTRRRQAHPQDRVNGSRTEVVRRSHGNLCNSMLAELRGFDFTELAAGQGCVGLQNLGNTCFMNSILQALNAVPELVAWCHTKVELPHGKTNIANAYVRLVRDMWKAARMGVVSPSSLLTWLGRMDSRWSHGNQQDAQELLHALLEALQAECNRVHGKPAYKELSGKGTEADQAAEADAYARTWHDSIVDDIFGGLLQSTLQCQVCQKQSHCFEPFLDLALPIPAGGSSITVQDCLKAFVEEERLEGSESVRCEACKKACPHTKRLQIWRPPVTLVLTLKRFAQRGSTNLFSRFRSASKNSVAVSMEVDELQLSPYCNPAGLKSQAGTALRHPAYQLVSISHHSGSLEGGHYTASGRSAVDGQWYNFNDSHVRPESAPLGASSSAYVLVYRLVS